MSNPNDLSAKQLFEAMMFCNKKHDDWQWEEGFMEAYVQERSHRQRGIRG